MGVFNKTIIPLALVGYEMIIANSALRASLAIYHLIFNAPSWNNCLLGCIFPFNSTDDSLKAQGSVETKRKASQQQTELHEGACFRTNVESIIKIANVNYVARDIGFFLRKWSTSFKSLKAMSLCLTFTYV